MSSFTRWFRDVISRSRNQTAEAILERGPTRVVSLIPPVRCEARKREGSRSWRCVLEAGHENGHLNTGGGRRW